MRLILGSKKTFLDFLNNLSDKDRIGILTHNDLDGIASAIFVQEILRGIGLKQPSLLRFLEYKPSLFEKTTPLLKNKNISALFLTDLAADDFDLKGFEKLRREFKTVLIDHHPLNVNLKNKRNIIKTHSYDCAALVVYNLGVEANNYFNRTVFNYRKWGWLVSAAIVAEVSYNNPDNLKLLRKFYPSATLENIHNSIPDKISKRVFSALAYYEDVERVYRILLNKNLKKLETAHKHINREMKLYSKKFHREAEFFQEKDIYFYYFNPKFKKIVSSLATSLSFKHPDKTIIIASDADTKTIKISARNQSGRVNVNLLMKKAIKGLKSAMGGGHAKAAAARIMKKDLQKFKENLLSS